MSEQERAISQLCIAIQDYCNEMREAYDNLDNDYYLDCIEHCAERIHGRVNPDFNKICEPVEAFEREQENDE